jgi:Glutaminyl-tRNA synthetase, non-specific RNA binding region part 1
MSLIPCRLMFTVVGAVVTPEQVYQSVTDYVEANVSASTVGWTHLSSVLSGVKNVPALRWANTFDVKTAVEHVFTDRYGPKELVKLKAKVSIISHNCQTSLLSKTRMSSSRRQNPSHM